MKALTLKEAAERAVEEWTKAMLLANDKELVTALGAADTKEAVDRAMRAVAAKRLERFQRDRDSGAYVPAIKLARAFVPEQSVFWIDANIVAPLLSCR